MKNIVLGAVLAGLVGSMAVGCAYAGVGASGDKAIVARNDAFLFGILRKVYVCKVADSGLTGCHDSESP